METVTRNVKDIGTADRQALEHVIGRNLADDQRVVIRVLKMDLSNRQTPESLPADAPLPDWCNVYQGLTDEAISSLEETLLTRADLGRAAE